MTKKILLLLFLISRQLMAQVSIKDSSINAVLVGMGAGLYTPAGDMADRFGNNVNIHLSCALKRTNNWIFGIEGEYIFGNTIKEPNIFKNIQTNDGFIIGNDGKFATVRTFERGYIATFNVSKVLPLLGPNKNSGFIIKAGVGFMQHKIKIDPIGNTVPYLDKEHRKGYDRLSNGLALHQFIGYQYLGNTRAINFFGGFELFEGFTQSRRSYNHDTMIADTKKRTDILIGFKVGWILPLYKQAPSEFYY
ncbi:MAG: hypothetical protein JNK61_02125 [Bacteroidia bacterium]|nr:hypothetical protein [Bacteroidia bacterium]HQV00497.1 hypothetical protein [Bacteroidia bacterium]